MSDVNLVKCRKCGKPLGYVTVLVKSVFWWHPLRRVKMVGICVEYFQKG